MTSFLHLVAHRGIPSFRAAVICAILTTALPAVAVEPEPGTTELIKRLSLEEADKALRDNPRWRKPDRIGVQVPRWISVHVPDALERYRRAAGSVEIVEITGPSDPRVAKLSAVVGFCTGALLKAAPNLLWVHNYPVGVENCTLLPDIGKSDELHALAARADVVVNALPLTRETQQLFDRKFFDAVKRGAYFISVGRGESTVTSELVAALKDGRLRGAGLDVVDPEPLPREHELWKLPNVIITPHISSQTVEARKRMATVAIENVRRYVAGEKLLNAVDLKAGY